MRNERIADRRRASGRAPTPRTVAVAVALAVWALLPACASNSNSEIKGDGGAAGAGGGTAVQTGSGGSAGSGSADAGAGGAPGTGGATGSGGTGGGGGGSACPSLTAYTQADHTILNVTWPAGLATMGGTGQVHIWNKTAFTASGNTLSATSQACGTVLPPTGLTALGGGGMVLIEIPNASWDAPTMPKFQFQATQSGWNVGSTMSYSYTALVGLTLTDPTVAWPTSYTGITMTVDADGDGNPALTSVPRTGGGFVAPPTSITQTARVDLVYIVSRNAVSVMATRSACDQASGTVTFTHFDNHVVGCHVMGGADCMPNETNFVDQNRTIYQVSTATFQSKTVASTATCADVRAALPM